MARFIPTRYVSANLALLESVQASGNLDVFDGNFLGLRESKAKLIDLFPVLKIWDLTLRSVCISRVLQFVWRWQFFAEFDRCGVC